MNDPSAPDPIDIELAGMVWHDEAHRVAETGELDPPDRCLCNDCTTRRS